MKNKYVMISSYANIEYCLQQYTAIYRNGTSYSDTHVADTDNVGWLTSGEYTELKNSMLKSVYENGGFYIGRYEAGIAENRTSKSATNLDGKYTIEGLPTPAVRVLVGEAISAIQAGQSCSSPFQQ